jgi:membrane protein YqaA with SNARE-associated domain
VNVLKHWFVLYKAWIMARVAPLGGPWAVFFIALIDGSIFGVPLDPLIAYYVVIDPRRTILYAVMASVGSALGSTIPYLIGYKGGEALVVKRLGEKRFARVHALSEKWGDLALIIPTLMPPGFPLKAFALMAGVTEMSYARFLLSIFLGRLIRFLGLAAMIIAYGPEILHFIVMSCRHHLGAVAVAAITVIVLIAAGGYYLKPRTRAKAESETIVV